MGFQFASLPYKEIESRIVKAHVEVDCFKAMAKEFYDSANANLQVREFEHLKGDKRVKGLKDLAQRCADDLPKYRNFRWEEVVLHALTLIKAPRKRFNMILGHEDDEEALYPTIMRRLREEFGSAEVFNTSRTRSKFVRFADFTILKKGVLGKKTIISLDAKTKPAAFDHFLNQAHDFQQFSDEVYLVTTPGLILEAGTKYKNTAYAETSVTDRLEDQGSGMYILDKTSGDLNLALDAEKNGVDKEAKSKAVEELELI